MALGEKRGGYLKLWRSLLTWRWYRDTTITRLFVHLILTVNYRAEQGIASGERLTSLAQLCAETGLTTQQVRTALDKLAGTGDIVMRSTKLGRAISLRRWDYWQNEARDQQIDNKGINRSIGKEEIKASNKGTKAAMPSPSHVSKGRPSGSTKLVTKRSTDRSADRSTNYAGARSLKKKEQREEKTSPKGERLSPRTPVDLLKWEKASVLVNLLRDELRTRDLDLDGSIKKNRIAASELLSRMDMEQASRLITDVKHDKLHRMNATSVMYLAAHANKIKASTRPRSEQDEHQAKQAFRSALRSLTVPQLREQWRVKRDPHLRAMIEQEVKTRGVASKLARA